MEILFHERLHAELHIFGLRGDTKVSFVNWAIARKIHWVECTI